MKVLKLTEVTDRKEVGGSIIYLHVPKTEEKQWAEKFRGFDFVDWAELNYYLDFRPLN